jgi:hypothetical protein
MEIPKTFKIGERAWRVRTDGAALPSGVYGMCYPRYEVIRVAKRAPQDMTESFWHEVTHAVLFDMNHPRWDDEEFVTAFSKRLTQVIHTAEFL